MSIFPGQWTRGTILDQALKKAGNTKIRALAREKLNRVLENLYTQHEWPFLFTETNVAMTVPENAIAVPDDFLKPAGEKDTSLRVRSVAGAPTDTPVIETDRIAFRRRAIPFNQTGERPLIWYMDYAQSAGLVWPLPSSSVVMSLLYKALPPSFPTTDEVAYDADTPLFPWGSYLADAMETWALEYDGNLRAPQARADLSASLDRILNIALPLQSIPDTALLDPEVFLRPFRSEESPV